MLLFVFCIAFFFISHLFCASAAAAATRESLYSVGIQNFVLIINSTVYFDYQAVRASVPDSVVSSIHIPYSKIDTQTETLTIQLPQTTDPVNYSLAFFAPTFSADVISLQGYETSSYTIPLIWFRSGTSLLICVQENSGAHLYDQRYMLNFEELI